MLGDSVKQALETVGVTQDRVEQWLGRPCNCKERQERLNQLDAVCRRILRGRIEGGKRYVETLLE